MNAQTDLSKKIRHGLDYGLYLTDCRVLLAQAAEEIERYYTGMLNWKASAERTFSAGSAVVMSDEKYVEILEPVLSRKGMQRYLNGDEITLDPSDYRAIIDRAALSAAAAQPAQEPVGAEKAFLEEWLTFAATPVGLECCGQSAGECCGNGIAVERGAEEVIAAMAERHRELTSAMFQSSPNAADAGKEAS